MVQRIDPVVAGLQDGILGRRCLNKNGRVERIPWYIQQFLDLCGADHDVTTTLQNWQDNRNHYVKYPLIQLAPCCLRSDLLRLYCRDGSDCGRNVAVFVTHLNLMGAVVATLLPASCVADYFLHSLFRQFAATVSSHNLSHSDIHHTVLNVAEHTLFYSVPKKSAPLGKAMHPLPLTPSKQSSTA